MRVRCVRLSRENHTTAGHNGGGTMRTADAGRIVACCVVVCVLAASCSCFRVRTTLAAGAAEPFAGGESPGDNDHRREPAADPVAPHCNDIDGDRRPRWFLGIDWRRAGSGMADHWWIVAVSSLLSLAVLWRIQCNVRKKVTDEHTCGRANPARSWRRPVLTACCAYVCFSSNSGNDCRSKKTKGRRTTVPGG